MPVVNNIARCDIALLSSTAGAIPMSTGPQAAAIPLFDPDFSRLDGINILKTPNTNGYLKESHNISGENPSDFPFVDAYVGEMLNGIRDHIYVRGYPDDTTAAVGYPSYTQNIENWYDWGDGVNTTLEIHDNYKSADRTVSYRTVNRAIYLDSHSYDEQYRCRDITWYARLGTLPLLHINTANGDGGTVTIRNNGTANPFRIDSASGGLFLFNTGSTGGFSINNVQFADASNTTRTSPAISIQGYYWNGSASTGASTTLQHVVASTSSNYLRLITGSASHYFQSDGKVGLAIPGLPFLTEQLVIPYGNIGIIRQNQGGTVKVLGIDDSNRVVLSPGTNGILFGAAFVGQLGGLLGATSGQRGIFDARGTVWFGAPGSTHAIVNGNDGVYVNCNAGGSGSNFTEFASGRSTTSGGTFQLSLKSDGRNVSAAPSTAPNDSILGNGQITFYLDQTGNNLKARVRYSDGTLKTCTVALT